MQIYHFILCILVPELLFWDQGHMASLLLVSYQQGRGDVICQLGFVVGKALGQPGRYLGWEPSLRTFCSLFSSGMFWHQGKGGDGGGEVPALLPIRLPTAWWFSHWSYKCGAACGQQKLNRGWWGKLGPAGALRSPHTLPTSLWPSGQQRTCTKSHARNRLHFFKDSDGFALQSFFTLLLFTLQGHRWHRHGYPQQCESQQCHCTGNQQKDSAFV